MSDFEENECFVHVNMPKERIEIPILAKAVEIRRNQLETIPELPNEIVYLDISDNRISCTSAINKFQKLKVVDLGYNLLKDYSISSNALEEIYLMANDIEEMTSTSCETPNLRKFDIANNKIRKINIQSICTPTLEEFYIGANKLEEIPDLNELKNLKILDLQFNHLVMLDCNLLPPTLTTLLLNNNKRLKEIKNIERLKNLELIGLTNTRVTGISVKKGVERWVD